MEFKDRLKKYRADNNLTQDDLADKLCVSRQAISKYETGTNYPNLSVMVDIAQLLGLSLDELLSKEEIAKETITANVSRRKNKRNVIIMAIAVALVVVISVTAIVLAVCAAKGVKDDGLQLMGVVGALNDEVPSMTALTQGKLFGCCFIVDGDKIIGKTYNTANSSIEMLGWPFVGIDGSNQTPSNAQLEFSRDIKSSCSVSMDVTVSAQTTTCMLYCVYYDKSKDEYVFENDYTFGTKNTVTVEMDKNNQHWKFVFNFKQVDLLQEITLFEYGMNSELLRTLTLTNERAYTVSQDCLYIVFKEKFQNAEGNVYYNYDVVLNSAIDRVLFYPLPLLNSNGYGTEHLEIRK